jgi:hypothetical protein
VKRRFVTFAKSSERSRGGGERREVHQRGAGEHHDGEQRQFVDELSRKRAAPLPVTGQHAHGLSDEVRDVEVAGDPRDVEEHGARRLELHRGVAAHELLQRAVAPHVGQRLGCLRGGTHR